MRRVTCVCLNYLLPQVCPYSRIFPVRTAVVRGLGRALDDRKRAIRKLAAKVRADIHS